jgi:hypothetical protein
MFDLLDLINYPRVYVVSDSQYKEALDKQKAAKRRELERSIEYYEKRIEELRERLGKLD